MNKQNGRFFIRFHKKVFGVGLLFLLALGSITVMGQSPVLDVVDSGSVSLFYVQDDGKVGIGTTGPNSILHIVTTDFDNLELEASRPTLFFHETDGLPNENFQIRLDAGTLRFQQQNDLQQVAVDTLVITQEGKVGIGTTMPDKLFHIAGSGIGKAEFIIEDTSQALDSKSFAISNRSATLQFGTQDDDGNNFTARMTLQRGGNVGIGTTNPDDELHVIGSVCASDLNCTTSDARLKRNIAPLTDALDRVTRLRGVSFDWDADANPRLKLSAGRKIGFVAQEVAGVLPDVVSEIRFRFEDEYGNVVSDETYYGISYSQMIPVLVDAIKEQQAIIDSQQAIIDSQKTRIDRIEAALVAAGILRQE